MTNPRQFFFPYMKMIRIAYRTCPGDIDFLPVSGLICMGTVIFMEKRFAIGKYIYVDIRYIQTLLVHGKVYFKALGTAD